MTARRRRGDHHRRGRRAPAGPHRRARAAPAAAALPLPERRRVPPRGRGATATTTRCGAIPSYATTSRVGRADRAAAARRRRHADRRGRGHRGRADDQRDLMKGDPLRGVHAFYSAQRPRVVGAAAARIAGCSAATRWSACSTSRASSPGGRCTSGRRRCSATTTGTMLVGPVPAHDPHRAREGAREEEVRRHRARRRTPTTQIDEIDAAVRRRHAAAAPSRAGGRTSTRATRSARW